MRFVVTPSPPHLHEIVPVTWHVEFIPPSIFTNMFPPNLVCHDEMMASFAILLKKKVSYMKKQPDLFLNPIKHLLKKTHSSITWLSFFSIHCKGQSGIRRHVHRRHVHLSCTWQPAHKLLPIKFITYDVTVNWLHQDWCTVMQQQRLRIVFVMSSWVDAFSNNCHHTLHINYMFCHHSVLAFIPSWVHSTESTTKISWQIEPLEVACLWF